MNIYFYDFETTYDKVKPQVYDWGIFSANFWKYGICMKEFFNTLRKFDKSITLFAANGAKFDSHFIVPLLIDNGFVQKKFKEEKRIINRLDKSKFREINIDPDVEFLLQPNEFTVFANEDKHIIEIRLGLESFRINKKGDKIYHTISIRDSIKLFPGSIKTYGKILNSHYKTNIYTKKELEGGYLRTTLYNSIEELEQDGNQLEYLKQDCYIGYSFLMMMKTMLPVTQWKLTAASTAYARGITSMVKVYIEDYVRDGKLIRELAPKATLKSPFYFYKWNTPKSKWKNLNGIGRDISKNIWPTDWLNENEDGIIKSLDMSKWFKGGLTNLNTDYKGLYLKGDTSVSMFDIKSSYGSQMVKNDFPYDKPFIGDGGDEYPLKLYKVETITDLYNKDGFPFIGILTGESNEYRKNYPAGKTIFMTCVELKRFELYYSGKYTKTVMYSFKKLSGNKVFGDYINTAYANKEEAKRNGNEALGQISKLDLNAYYGKFGSKPTIISQIYNTDIQEWERDGGVVKTEYYLPVAIFITAYARMSLVDAVGFNYKYFIYCDTDSIFVRTKYKHLFNLQIGKEIGNWEEEFDDMEGIVRRAKQYIFHDKQKAVYKTAFAGIRYKDEEYPSMEHFIKGDWRLVQLRPVKLPTGIVLVDSLKEIYPVWDYTPHPEDWFSDINTYFDNYKKQLDYVVNL